MWLVVIDLIIIALVIIILFTSLGSRQRTLEEISKVEINKHFLLEEKEEDTSREEDMDFLYEHAQDIVDELEEIEVIDVLDNPN